MRERRLGALALLAAGVGGQQPADGAAVRDGAHFRVELHRGPLPAALGDRLADQALITAESVWPVVDKQLQLRPAARPVVHVWFERKGYAQARDRGQGTERLQAGAFTAAGGAECHVLIQPEVSGKVLDRTDLPASTRRAIVRQAIAALLEQDVASLPARDDWTLDLLTMGLSDAVCNPARKPGVEADWDTRRSALAWSASRGDPLKLGWFWHDPKRPGQPVDVDARANYHAVTADYLASDDAGYAKKLLVKLRARGKRESVHDQRKQSLESLLGKDWEKTEAQFAKFQRSLPAVWRVDVPMLELRGSRALLVGAEPNAHAWRVAKLPAGGYVLRCTLQLLGPDDVEARFLLDKTDAELVGVLITRDGTSIGVFDRAAVSWKMVATSAAPVLLDAKLRVDVEVGGGLLRVVIDDVERCRWETGTRGMHAEWGIACFGAAWFDDLRAEPMAPTKK